MEDVISVVVIIYRVEAYLEKCIQSIITQTYRNLEIILVNDGSDDGCREICDTYGAMDSRIKVIHKKNGGMADARREGTLAATGKYIAYVDGDDWVEPDMYESLHRLITEHDVMVVESGVIDSCGDVEKQRRGYFNEGCYKGDDFAKEMAPYLMYSGEFFRHGISPYMFTKLYVKEKIEEFILRPEPGKNLVDDIMCVLPCILQSRSVYVTKECFYHYRVRENSAKRLIRNDIADEVKKHYREWLQRFDSKYPTDHAHRQVYYFIMYLLIAKAMWVFDDEKEKTFLKPYGEIEKNSKIILYGAGTVGIHMKYYIEEVSKESLIYWADRNFKQFPEGMKVQSPGKINSLPYDYVVLAILESQAAHSAKRDLMAMGVPEEKICWIKPEYIQNPNLLLGYARLGGERLIEE